MKRLILPLIAIFLILPLTSEGITQSKTTSYSNGGVKLELSEPAGSIYRPGESVSFTYQTKENAYVVLFDIDTDGYIHLIYPYNGRLSKPATGGKQYTVPEHRGNSLFVEGNTGIEFVFALAVVDRNHIDEVELEFLADNESLPEDQRFRIDGDPFLAANMIAGELVRGISHRPGVSLAYTYFNISERVPYPRYLCAECHDDTDRPYTEQCPEYEISANFDFSDNLTYPLSRGFELAQGEEAADEPYYEDEDITTTRVMVDFWPYRTEVVHHPQLWISSVHYNDWWYYDPIWDDPWGSWAVYYPYHPNYYYPRYHFWNSWGWNWGWRGHNHHGYWAGCWDGYYWGDHGYGHGYYSDRRPGHRRDVRPWNPRQRYKGPLTGAMTVAAKRDPNMRISTVKTPTRVKATSRINSPVRRKSPGLKDGKSHLKRPEVRRDRSYIFRKGDDTRKQNLRIQSPKTRVNPGRKDPTKLRKQPPVRRDPQRPSQGKEKIKSKPRRERDDSRNRAKQQPRSYTPRSKKTTTKSKAVNKRTSNSRKSPPRVTPSKSRSSSGSKSSNRSYRPPSRSSSSSKSTPSRSSSGSKSRSSSKSSGKSGGKKK